MPFVATNSFLQASDGQSFSVVDTSDYAGYGGQAAFTNRRLWIYYIDGTTVTFTNAPDFSFASYPSNLITLPLQRDYAFQVVMTVEEIAGSVTYTADNIVVLTGNTKLYINGLVQQIAAPAQPNVLNDTNWFNDLSKLQDYLDCAENAGYYSQQFNAQASLDAAYFIIQNNQYEF